MSASSTGLIAQDGVASFCLLEKEGNSLVIVPWLRERLDQVGPRRRQLVVDVPAAGQVALAALGRLGEGKERNDVAGVGVEDLLLRRVRGRANLVRVDRRRQVLDVREGDVGRLATEAVVLAATGRRDVRGEPRVDGNVVLARVPFDGDAAHDLEAVPVVNLPGDVAQDDVQRGQGKGGLRNLPERLFKAFLSGLAQVFNVLSGSVKGAHS